jgi:hypothetical protein
MTSGNTNIYTEGESTSGIAAVGGVTKSMNMKAMKARR